MRNRLLAVAIVILSGCTSDGKFGKEAVYYMLQDIEKQRTPVTDYDQYREPQMDYQEYKQQRQEYLDNVEGN